MRGGPKKTQVENQNIIKMKTDITFAALIILLLIWATYSVISTAYAARIEIVTESHLDYWGQPPMTLDELCTATILKWTERCDDE